MPAVVPYVSAFVWGAAATGATAGAIVMAELGYLAQVVLINAALGALQFTDEKGNTWTAE